MPRSSGRMNRERSKGTPAVQSSGKKRPENENENLKSKYFMIFYDILEQREAIGWKKTMVCTESNRSSIRRHPTCRPQLILRPFRFFLRSRRFETFHSACCTTGPLWRVVQMLCNFQALRSPPNFRAADIPRLHLKCATTGHRWLPAEPHLRRTSRFTNTPGVCGELHTSKKRGPTLLL